MQITISSARKTYINSDYYQKMKQSKLLNVHRMKIKVLHSY